MQTLFLYIVLSLAGIPAAAAPAERGAFDNVLVNPDDPDRNLAYAQHQVLAGNLRTAMAALERVLMVDPNNHEARAYYAGLLLKSGLLDDAQYQIEILKPQELSKELRAQVRAIEREIARKRRKFHLQARLMTALDYDTNRNAAPGSSRRYVLGSLVPLPDTGKRKDDFAFTGLVGINAARDFGENKHQAFAAMNYLRTEQGRVDNLDLQVYSLRSGIRVRTSWADISPIGHLHHVRLREQTFLRIFGGGLRADKKLTGKLDGFIEGRASYHQYNRTRDIGAAPERSGRRGDILAGLTYTVRPDILVGADYTLARQLANKLYNAHTSNSIGLSAIWALKEGVFVAGIANSSYLKYDRADPLVSLTNRRDLTFRGRLTFGVPLSLFSGRLRSLLYTQSFEYFLSDSTLANYSYDNTKISMALTYKWEL